MRRTVVAVMVILGLVTAAGQAAAEGGRLQDVFATHTPGSGVTVDHRPFGRFLDPYLSPGPDGVNRFAYGRVSEADRTALKTYIAHLESVDVARLSRDEQFAFWANLYNAVTIDVVLDAWPVDTILDIKPTIFSRGPWKKDRVTVAGRELSLHDIEHNILRAIWRDPRVHYAVNCASIGCPNLHRRPLAGAGLDKRLDAHAREYVNHPRGAAFDERGRLTVSSIYKWFREDFGGTEQGVIAHLSQYAEATLRTRLSRATRISGYRYDWSLNSPPEGSGREHDEGR